MVYQGLKKNTLVIAILAALALVASACAPSQGQAVETTSIVERLNLEAAKAAYDEGAALFLDVRSSDAFASNHIPGAKSIPLLGLEGHLDELDPSQWIITYCT